MPSCNYNLTSALKPFYTFISRSSSIVCLLSIYNVHITVFSFFPRFRNAHILSFFVCFLHIHCLNINTVIFGSLSPWLNVYCTWCPQFWALCHPCCLFPVFFSYVYHFFFLFWVFFFMYQFMLLLCFTQLFVSHNFTYGSLEAKVQESQDNTQVLSVLYDQCVFNYKKKKPFNIL